MRSKKFVLDANVWISYFINDDIETLSNAVLKKKIMLPICAELLEELERVLHYQHLEKYKINMTNSLRLVKYLGIFYELQHPIKQYISADSDDNYIIALALQTNSGYVTSGDRHIQKEKGKLEKKHPKLKIITKSQFEHLVKS